MLFALLVGFTSYWAVFDAKGLEDNPNNRRAADRGADDPARPDLRQRRHDPDRGQPRASGARRRRASTCASYPTGGLFAHPIGYSFIQQRPARAGAARATTSWPGKENEFESIFAGLEGRDARGQRRRHQPRRGRHQRGGDRRSPGARARSWRSSPQTGKVRVMVSIPEYDPNRIPTDFQALNDDPNKPDAQPHHAGALSAGLDLQGGDRDGRRSTRASSRPTSIIDGSSPQDDQRRPAGQLRRRELRPDLAHRRADQLGQHGVRPGRREGRPRARSSST